MSKHYNAIIVLVSYDIILSSEVQYLRRKNRNTTMSYTKY